MPSFTSTALRMLRRLLGAPSREDGAHAGTATVLDGNTAVAVTEAGISEAAGLGASFPAETAELVWRTELQHHGVNLAGVTLGTLASAGPRGALSAAIGLAMSGTRATCFLSGPDLASAMDLLTVAAGRRLPLVIHLSERALAAHAPVLGATHQTIHLAADSGCFIFTAANAQEAVDFSLIARRLAERALVPGIVAMDGEQTALSVQEVRLPQREFAENYLGRAGDLISAPSASQQLLLGEQRRRVPRWHNPDRPVMAGSLQAPAVWGLAKAARPAFMDDNLADSLHVALEDFAEQTGRRYQPLSAHRLEGARVILVAQGAAIETLESVADHLRARQRIKVGVVGVRCLRPFPAADIVRLVGTNARICVLERLDAPLAADPPLLREVRAALERATGSPRSGKDTGSNYPELTAKQRPEQLLSVVYGLGGFPLRGADLIELCRNLDKIRLPQVYLGVDFSRNLSTFPKRQVLLDRLRRSHPDVIELGVHDAAASPDLRPDDSLTLDIHRLSGGTGQGLLPELAAMLQRLSMGGLRGRPALITKPWGEHCRERLHHNPSGMRDPGDESPVDLALLTTDSDMQCVDLHQGLVSGSAILVRSDLPDDALWEQLSESTRAAIKDTDIRLYRVPSLDNPETSDNEYLLGAVFGVLLDAGLLETTQRRLLSIRKELLSRSLANTARPLSGFETGANQAREIETAHLPRMPVRAGRKIEDEAPALVRRLGNTDDAYDSLPRFWDQVGVLYDRRKTEELAPDPYLAVGAVPPLSASFRNLSPLRRELPAFDPTLCTACGDCWSSCPDSAIYATAVSPARLLDASIRKTGGDALRPIAPKLASGIAQLCQQRNPVPTQVDELLGSAYGRIADKLPFPEARKTAIKEDLDRVQAHVGCLPVAITNPLFHEPEQRQKGSGELLLLAVDPEGCKECGICVTSCEPAALQMAHQSSRFLAESRRVRKAWHELPETNIDTIRMLERNPDVGTTAATLMSHGSRLGMAGGDGSEPGCGSKLALRLTLSVADALQAPRFGSFLEQVNSTQQQITGLIRDTLAGALPADDLDALSRGLELSDTRRADMTAIIGEAEHAMDSAVDAARLRRLVDLARELSDLAWRLSTGRQGMGRSPVSLVVSPGSPVGWSGSFPHSPYSAPVTVDATGDGVQLAAGLLEGQLRQATEGFVLMRKARAELEQPADAARLWKDLDSLTWRDLDESERALCPSLLLVGDSELLAGRGLGQLIGVLGDDLPIRILLLSNLDLGLTAKAGLESPLSAVNDATLDMGLLALTRRNAYVAQTSIGTLSHLATTVQTAFGFRGPALLHVHAPSPSHHGFSPHLTLQRAQAAVDSRIFPLFRYDPDAAGVFGSRMDLEDNPAPLSPWFHAASGTAFTPADWALGEERFSHGFSPLEADDEKAIPIEQYLALPQKEREKQTPFVEQASNGSEPQRLRVDKHLVRVTEESQQTWRMLQELAGLVTPFTDRVRQEAEARVAENHEAELAAQAKDYEQRLRDLRSTLQEENRSEVRERLLRLAGYPGTPKEKSG